MRCLHLGDDFVEEGEVDGRGLGGGSAVGRGGRAEDSCIESLEYLSQIADLCQVGQRYLLQGALLERVEAERRFGALGSSSKVPELSEDLPVVRAALQHFSERRRQTLADLARSLLALFGLLEQSPRDEEGMDGAGQLDRIEGFEGVLREDDRLLLAEGSSL